MSKQRFARRLLLVLFVALCFRIVVFSLDTVPSIDEVSYLNTGQSLWDGRGFTENGVAETHFPPLIPAILGGLATATTDPHDATVVLSIVASTLLLIPLVLITRSVAGGEAAMASGLFAAFAPGLTTTLARQGGGSESLFTLFLVCAVWSAVVAMRVAGWKRMLLTVGAAVGVGVAYLSRPEGLLVAPVLALALAVTVMGGWSAISGRRIRDVLRGGAVGLVFSVVLLAFVAPYAAYLHGKTGSWQVTGKSHDTSIDAWYAVARGDRNDRNQERYALNETDTRMGRPERPLTELAREDPGTYARIFGTNVVRLFTAFFKPWTYAPPGWLLLPGPVVLLCLFGFWRYRRRPVGVVLGFTALAVSVIPVAFFILPRYLAPLTAIVVVFCGAGYAALDRSWKRPVAALSAVLMLVSVVTALRGPGWSNPPREPREVLALGRWLNEHADARDTVMTHSPVALYAQRRRVALPYADPDRTIRFARLRGADYLVIDDYVRRFRLPLAPLLTAKSWPGVKLVLDKTYDGIPARIFEVMGRSPSRDSGSRDLAAGGR